MIPGFVCMCQRLQDRPRKFSQTYGFIAQNTSEDDEEFSSAEAAVAAAVAATAEAAKAVAAAACCNLEQT